jgi:pimeloyl-ACP methyl ester carboxylesterase
VLVHGSFSDHLTNWEFVKPLLEPHFTVYAVARRGRGETSATEGHRLEDEAQDLVAILETTVEPVFLLGHSYGAHVSLVAASLAAERVRKLVLYEPAWPHIVSPDAIRPLETSARAGDWDTFAFSFFRDVLRVPGDVMDEVRGSDLWAPIIADAPASLGDLRAIIRYGFTADRFRGLRMPVLLQTGSESPPALYVTDALAAVLPDARIEVLPDQAHEGMTTAPALYADSVIRFLRS